MYNKAVIHVQEHKPQLLMHNGNSSSYEEISSYYHIPIILMHILHNGIQAQITYPLALEDKAHLFS